MPEFYIGLMSGTSLDGIDACLVDFSGGKIKLLAFHYQAFSAQLRQQIHELSQAGQAVFLSDYGLLDSRLGELFAEAVLALLDRVRIEPTAITAIGSHGQTVYHSPEPPFGFTLQIGDPNRIAEITGITTVADFRRRDIAAGGQGAPLVPAFHHAVFAESSQARTVVNIGGIANITVLNNDRVSGFDTGPGNTLMNLWCEQHLNQPYDKDGEWAASGKVNSALLLSLKDDDYFRLKPPKSTGKEYFSMAWLQRKLKPFSTIKPEDVQATLCRLTAETISDAILNFAPDARQVLICGGGAHNRRLIKLLKENLDMPVVSTGEFGIDPDHVEAMAFAWLARQTINGLPGNLSGVTGARTPVVLGGIYPGKNGVLR